MGRRAVHPPPPPNVFPFVLQDREQAGDEEWSERRRGTFKERLGGGEDR